MNTRLEKKLLEIGISPEVIKLVPSPYTARRAVKMKEAGKSDESIHAFILEDISFKTDSVKKTCRRLSVTPESLSQGVQFPADCKASFQLKDSSIVITNMPNSEYGQKQNALELSLGKSGHLNPELGLRKVQETKKFLQSHVQVLAAIEAFFIQQTQVAA